MGETLKWPAPDDRFWRPVIKEMRAALASVGINPAIAETAVAEVRERLEKIDRSFTISAMQVPDECVPFVLQIRDDFLAGYRKVSDKLIAELCVQVALAQHARAQTGNRPMPRLVLSDS